MAVLLTDVSGSGDRVALDQDAALEPASGADEGDEVRMRSPCANAPGRMR